MTAPQDNVTTRERVVRSYFETTSSRNAANATNLTATLQGLGRLLGDWSPQPGAHIVDLGSGMGETCAFAMQRGAASATGINLSEGENALARTLAPDATFLDADLVTGMAGIADNSVDGIYALNILEHLDKEQLSAVLENAARILKPSGYLVAVTPNAGSPFGAMTRYWDITHQIAYTPSSIRQIGLLCGFTGFAFRECGPRPHGIVSGIRYILWQFIRLKIKIRLLIELASTKEGIYTADMLMKLTK
jgi:SAM-dependent methyltransferase